MTAVAEEMAEIRRMLESHERRIGALEASSERDATKKRSSSSSSKPSITDHIEGLKAEGFFDKPKPLGEIVKRLAQGSYHYPQQSLTGPLQRAVRQKVLGRVKKDGKWAYCKR